MSWWQSNKIPTHRRTKGGRYGSRPWVDYQTKGGGSLNEDKRRRKQNMRRRAGGKVRLINVDADNNQEEMD